LLKALKIGYKSKLKNSKKYINGNVYENKQPRAVKLSSHDSYIRKVTYKTSKLGQTDLVFGL